MNFAFCLFKFFPYGGLQRDLLRIGRACLDGGHSLNVFTAAWEGEVPPGFDITLVPWRGFSNHAQCRSFGEHIRPLLAGRDFDVVVGFNKMPGLDVYYAADSCFAARARQRHGLYRLSRRYRTFADLETAVFSPQVKTEILLIAPAEKEKFQACYGTPDERFHLLPPGISPDRRRPENAAEIASAVRGELQVGAGEKLVLMVGSAFRTKGVDRALRAMAALPADVRSRTLLVVIGQGNPKPFRRLARRLGVEGQLRILGPREDVPRFLLAADLLLHPARTENTGTVLLEALAAGLPVLATEICGYGFHVREAQGGLLVSAPFRQEELNEALARMLRAGLGEAREKALAYVRRTDIFSLPEKAAEIIEQVGRRRIAGG